ncbi:SDR family NAD(P)-dependent oxidoreductase [Streptomyces kaniharaensis]|uniref:SDR family NAD(P)-dependent oxidoreductase n=1 Tax=Streptomyces kaniharaensis TaxID=212423 RepID=UPI003899E5AF
MVGAIAPTMAERGSGVIVNIGSWTARASGSFAAVCTATKPADEQLTRGWAAEYGLHGVRVNAVAPDVTLAPGNEAHRAIPDAVTAATPAGVVIQPDRAVASSSTGHPGRHRPRLRLPRPVHGAGRHHRLPAVGPVLRRRGRVFPNSRA